MRRAGFNGSTGWRVAVAHGRDPRLLSRHVPSRNLMAVGLKAWVFNFAQAVISGPISSAVPAGRSEHAPATRKSDANALWASRGNMGSQCLSQCTLTTLRRTSLHDPLRTRSQPLIAPHVGRQPHRFDNALQLCTKLNLYVPHPGRDRPDHIRLRRHAITTEADGDLPDLLTGPVVISKEVMGNKTRRHCVGCSVITDNGQSFLEHLTLLFR